MKLGNLLPNPYYWAGNEHDMLAPFMFNWGPNCTKSQYWARQVRMWIVNSGLHLILEFWS